MSHLLAQEVPPQVFIPALRVALGILAGAFTALGLRRGGHNFISSLAHDIVNAPVSLARTWDHVAHRAHKGAAEDALEQQNPTAEFFSRLAALVGLSAFALRHLADGGLQALHVLRKATIPSMIHAATMPLKALAHDAAWLARYANHRVARLAHAEALDFRYARDSARAASEKASVALKTAIAIPIDEALRLPGELTNELWKTRIRPLGRRLTRVEKLLGVGALAGLIVNVIARHIPWFKCPGVNRAMKQLCRTPPRFLGDILTLFADFLVLTNICRVIPWLEAGFEEVATPLIDTLAKAASRLCKTTDTRPGTLDVPPLSFPPAASTIYLP